MAPGEKSASGKILHNSLWYGLETLVETVLALGTSIAVARYLGPQKLGYYSYINFFVMIVTRTSGTGLANATRKYMSEFLAVGDEGSARAVYHFAYRYQLLGAMGITLLGLAAVLLFGDPAFRIPSVLLILAITPGVMSWVPANANQAFEDVSKNTLSAFGYLIVYTTIIVLTIWLKWDLTGVAAALLIGRTVEVVMRTIPLHARLRTLPAKRLEKPLKLRIRRFCLQAIGLQLLMSVVWDRSEMVFLKAYCSLEQIAFYSVSFGLVTNLLVVPRTFGAATGISLMVEAGRDPGRIRSIVDNASRYLLLIALPVHLGAAAVTRSAIGLTYGTKYLPAVPVLIIASILALPRAFQEIGEVLMRAADRQKNLLVSLSLAGALNIALDWVLIPRYGAVGAAWGNGIAQSLGICVVWWQARQAYDFSFPAVTAARLAAASLGMAGVAWFVSHAVAGWAGLVAAVAIAAPVYVLLVRLLRGLQASDRSRLEPIGRKLGPARNLFAAAIQFATPAAEA